MTVDVVNANFEYVTDSKQFSTLWENYDPENVTFLVNENFTRNPFNDSLVDVTILWEPAFGNNKMLFNLFS